MRTPRSRLSLLVTGVLAVSLVAALPAGAEEDHPKPPPDRDGAVTLTLLHNNDGESSLLSTLNPVDNEGTEVSLPVGGVAAFKAVTDREIADARALGNAVVNVYAGDSFLASATLACSLPPNPPETPVYDAVAQRQIPYDAHIFGNHEFDFSPDFLERFIRNFDDGSGLSQPFLSANLDFSGEPGFADLLDRDGLVKVGRTKRGRVIGRSAIVTDAETGQRFGIVAATTPLLASISSPRDVVVTSTDNASTAAVAQAEIDRLIGMGVEKILFVSHLQDVENDRALIPLLRGVDVAVAGGGDELLANSPDVLLPGDPDPVGPYPIEVTDADGRTVYIVTTSGNYRYLGRVDAEFDEDGEVVAIDAEASSPRRVLPASPEATELGLADTVTPDDALVASVEEPVRACLDALAEPIASSEVLLNTARGSATELGVRTGETNSGNLAADAFVDSYDRYAEANGLPARDFATNPVVAIQNGGGLRQPPNQLPVAGAPGPITRADTLTFMAFLTNTITVVNDVTPDELKTIFERSAGVDTQNPTGCIAGGGQFLQVSGLRVAYDCTLAPQIVTPPPTGATVGEITQAGARVVELALDPGTPTDPSDDVPIVTGGAVVAGAPAVRVVTNSFTAAGGDNYPTLAAKEGKVNLPATYEQALVEYLATFPATGTPPLPTIPATDTRYAAAAGEGRIVITR
jgi:2',3'-cyclic-nucleotide 2'-phosphodiesterase / 3'-nucleotidase / 5'-nucleotidase